MLQQHETTYFGYTIFGSHVQITAHMGIDALALIFSGHGLFIFSLETSISLVRHSGPVHGYRYICKSCLIVFKVHICFYNDDTHVFASRIKGPNYEFALVFNLYCLYDILLALEVSPNAIAWPQFINSYLISSPCNSLIMLIPSHNLNR